MMGTGSGNPMEYLLATLNLNGYKTGSGYKTETEEEEEDLDEDPFDTSIVDKVIPIRAAKKSSEISVEDEDFDPTRNFKSWLLSSHSLQRK